MTVFPNTPVPGTGCWWLILLHSCYSHRNPPFHSTNVFAKTTAAIIKYKKRFQMPSVTNKHLNPSPFTSSCLQCHLECWIPLHPADFSSEMTWRYCTSAIDEEDMLGKPTPSDTDFQQHCPVCGNRITVLLSRPLQNCKIMQQHLLQVFASGVSISESPDPELIPNTKLLHIFYTFNFFWFFCVAAFVFSWWLTLSLSKSTLCSGLVSVMPQIVSKCICARDEHFHM